MSTPQMSPAKKRPRSAEIFSRAEQILVGGVNSPVRAFRSVGGDALIMGARPGRLRLRRRWQRTNRLCLLLGSDAPRPRASRRHRRHHGTSRKGTSFGVTTELELQLATLIRDAIPFLEKIRFVSSGTEATMSALRLARGVTRRDLLLKFEGCYHVTPTVSFRKPVLVSPH